MANGQRVFDGVIANNCLPFGTQIELNNKTYTVTDRMNKRYNCDYFDIWFANTQDAFIFGRQDLIYKLIK